MKYFFTRTQHVIERQTVVVETDDGPDAAKVLAECGEYEPVGEAYYEADDGDPFATFEPEDELDQEDQEG